METLVKSGKVKRVLPEWKVKLAQGVADFKMQEADALGDLLNREVAGGGGGALGMGAPTAASRKPATKLEEKLHTLSAKLTPEVQSYEAVFSWPKDKKKIQAPGERDVAVPLAPRNVGGGGDIKPAAVVAVEAQPEAPKSITIDLAAQLKQVKELKALLSDPKRNPFLSADPPKFVADKKQAAAAIVAAKQTLVADLNKSLEAAKAAGVKAVGGKVEGVQQALNAKKGGVAVVKAASA
jgi:hypothetical protein